MILRFPGIERTTPEFRQALIAIGARLHIDPNAIAAVMSIESGFRPDARNPHGGAVGLIQFMPFLLKAWGTTSETVQAMRAVEQLQLVERFYSNAKGITDPGTLYMLTFMPAAAYLADTFVLGQKDSEETLWGLSMHKIYEQNAGLDSARDGDIKVGEVKELARKRYSVAQALGSLDPPTPESGLLPLDLDWDEVRRDRDAYIKDKEDS